MRDVELCCTTLGLGCRIFDSYYGCLLYADDILLLSHSVNAIVQSDTTGLSGGVPDTHTSTCWAAVYPSPEAVPEDAWENI